MHFPILRGKLDLQRRSGILKGVAGNIIDDLLEAELIREDQALGHFILRLDCPVEPELGYHVREDPRAFFRRFDLQFLEILEGRFKHIIDQLVHGVGFCLDDLHFLQDIRIFILDFHHFAGRLDRRDRRLNVMGQLGDKFFFTAVRFVFPVGSPLQFFSHAVKRLGKRSEVVPFPHLQRYVKISFRDMFCKHFQIRERTHEKIPHDKEESEPEEERTGKDQKKDHLLIISSAFILFFPRCKCDLSADRICLFIIKDRISFADEQIILGIIGILRDKYDTAVISGLQVVGSSSRGKFLSDIIGAGIQIEHIDLISLALLDPS